MNSSESYENLNPSLWRLFTNFVHILSFVASFLGVFAFVTGKTNLQEFFPNKKQTGETRLAQIQGACREANSPITSPRQENIVKPIFTAPKEKGWKHCSGERFTTRATEVNGIGEVGIIARLPKNSRVELVSISDGGVGDYCLIRMPNGGKGIISRTNLKRDVQKLIKPTVFAKPVLPPTQILPEQSPSADEMAVLAKAREIAEQEKRNKEIEAQIRQMELEKKIRLMEEEKRNSEEVAREKRRKERKKTKALIGGLILVGLLIK